MVRQNPGTSTIVAQDNEPLTRLLISSCTPLADKRDAGRKPGTKQVRPSAKTSPLCFTVNPETDELYFS